MRDCFLASMLRQSRALLWGLLLALLPCTAQAAVSQTQHDTSRELLAENTTASSTPATLEAALRALADQADVIFTGEVVSIDSRADAVEVRWQVEAAVRGAAAGQVYVLREWVGLWQSDSTRYVKGQRALLLLHAPSAAGYASPVGGSDGVIALRGNAESGTLDLRLLQQRVLVTDAARLRPALALRAAGGSLAVSDALQREAARQAPTLPRTVAAARSSAQVRLQPEPDGNGTPVVTRTQSGSTGAATAVDANSRVDAGMVVDMLKAWQRGAAR